MEIRHDTVDEPSSGGSGWWKIVVLAGVIVAAAVVVRVTGAHEYLTIHNLRAFRESAGVWAPILFVLAYIVGAIVAFPGSLLSLSGGLLFGTLLGGTLIVIGATIGATCA